MITNKNEAKAMTNKFYVIVNANSIVLHVSQIQNWITKHVNLNVKIIVHIRKIIAGLLGHVFVRIVTSVIAFDEIISAMDILSKNDKCYSSKCANKIWWWKIQI